MSHSWYQNKISYSDQFYLFDTLRYEFIASLSLLAYFSSVMRFIKVENGIS